MLNTECLNYLTDLVIVWMTYSYIRETPTRYEFLNFLSACKNQTIRILQRIRKLLIDDYQILSKSMNKQLSQAGQNVVARVKKITGAQAMDTLLNISGSKSITWW